MGNGWDGCRLSVVGRTLVVPVKIVSFCDSSSFSISFWSMAHGIGLANGDAAFLKLDALKRSRCVVVQYAPEKPTTISVNR